MLVSFSKNNFDGDLFDFQILNGLGVHTYHAHICTYAHARICTPSHTHERMQACMHSQTRAQTAPKLLIISIFISD